jgi:hypothetical protein
MMGISALLDFFEEPPEAGIVSDSFAAMGVFFRVETIFKRAFFYRLRLTTSSITESETVITREFA